MPEFMPEPCLTLETKEDVIAALADTSWKDQPYPYEYRVKSVWLISLIEEIIATTGRYFAYNSEVKRLAEQRLGYPAQNDAYYSKENNPLSTLIYNCAMLPAQRQATRRRLSAHDASLDRRGFCQGR